MQLSIVVVTWRSAGPLAALVESLNGRLDAGHELIVVDNASDDDPLAAARAWRGPGWFLRMERNLGYGAAANAGVAQASGEAVVLLNPDTRLADDGLPRLAATALRLRALVGPRVLNLDGSVQPSASGPPVGIWPWVRALAPGGAGPDWLLRRTAPWRLERLTRVAWLTGACVAAPREVLRELGPFDPAIHLYAEDLDLGLRAARAGIPSYFAPADATIVHEGKASTALAVADLGRGLAARNGRAVLRRRWGARRELLARGAELTGLRLRVAAKRALGRGRRWDELVLRGQLAARTAPELPPLEGAPAPAAPALRVPLGGAAAGSGTPAARC